MAQGNVNNAQLLKKLAEGKVESSASKSFTVPGLESVKKVFAKTSKKQAIDIALFSLGIYVMFKFGKSLGDKIDEQMPTEKGVMDMMRGMQGGMPPSPM